MTCGGQVQPSDVQQAIYWQKNLVAGDNRSVLEASVQTGENIKRFSGICHSSNDFTKSYQGDSIFSKTSPVLKYPEEFTFTAKGVPATKKTVPNCLTLQSKAFQDVITDMPPAKSLNSSNHTTDQTVQQMVSKSHEEAPLKPTWSGQRQLSRPKNIGCLCLQNTLSAFKPRLSGINVNSQVTRKADGLLPKNPWLSLPLGDHGMSGEITIRPSNLTTTLLEKGTTCILCSAHLKDQSAPPTVCKDISTCKPLNSNSVEIQVNEGSLKSVSFTRESAIQTDEGACYKLSKVENRDHVPSPVEMILSRTFTKTREENEGKKELTSTVDSHSFDQHLSRRVMVDYGKHKLANGVEWLFSDWELKEREELRNIENLLEKVENILWAMSPKELSNAGVIGIEEIWSDGIQPESVNYFNDSFMDKDHAPVGPGCMLSEVNRVAPKPQHSSKLFVELKELYAIEMKIWDENLKIEQLRELEQTGKVKDNKSFLHQTKDRLSFLAELQRERIEVEELEQSLAKEDLLKKRKLRKMPDVNKIKSHPKLLMSKSSGIASSKPIIPLVGCPDAPWSCSKNLKGPKGGHDQSLSDSVKTTIQQIVNKPVNQEDNHMGILTSTACKQESRIVEGSEYYPKDDPSSLSSIVKGNIRPPPSPVEDTNKYATDKRCGPIVKPRRAVVGKPCTPVNNKQGFSLCNNLTPKDHAIHEPLHTCAAQGNLKRNEVGPEVTGNVSSLYLLKEDTFPDTDYEPKFKGTNTSTACKYQPENNHCNSFEKSVSNENGEVAHSLRDGLDLKYLTTSTEGTLPQVIEKQEPLKDTPNTMCDLANIADSHSSQSLPQSSKEGACLNLKEREVKDSHEDLTDGFCLKMAPKTPVPERSHLQVSSLKLRDFKTPVVLDVGSGLMKAGFAGHDLPITVFPTVVGFTKEKIWHYTFYDQLRVNPEEHPIMLTEAAMDRMSKSQMAEVMFEVFHVPFAFVAVQAALALYSSGRTTGVVFSSGDEVTYTLPIYEGYALTHAVQRVNLAGQDLTNYLRKLLEKKGLLQASAKQEIVQQMKETCCYVAMNADTEPFTYVPYTLPDGQTIILGDERFRTAEVFFKPQLTGKHDYGVHESLVRSLLRSDVDLRKTFAENIVLSGGSSQLPGFSLRLQNEICSMMPLDLVDSVSVAILPDQEFAAWTGGSYLAQLPSFDTAWISRDEYYEFGSDIVYKRCF
ncbi:uncharacterized protein LOC144762887 isoform X2 [Lissotriton helveticus]